MTISPETPSSSNEVVIVAVVETTYGTDANPTGANAVRIIDPNFTPLAADKKTRNYVQPFLGSRPSTKTMKRTEMTGKLELCGYGSAVDRIPPQDGFLRALGLTRTEVAATPSATIAATATAKAGNTGTFTFARTTAYAGLVARTVKLVCTTAGASGIAKFTVTAPAVGTIPAYSATNVTMTDATAFALPGGAVITPTVGTAFALADEFTIAVQPSEIRYQRSSDRYNHASLSLYMIRDGKRQKMLGTRGTAGKLVFPVNDNPYLEFTMVGFFLPPDEVVPPTPDYSDWTDPDHVSTDNTPFFRAWGQDLVLSNFELDLGLSGGLKERVGRKVVRINNWAGRFSATVEEPDLSDIDFISIAENDTVGTIEFMHGTEAGRVIAISGHQAQLDAPSLQDDEGDAMMQLAGDLFALTGDDELTIAFR